MKDNDFYKKNEAYLRKLAHSTFAHLPKEIEKNQKNRISRDVDDAIMKGALPRDLIVRGQGNYIKS